MAITELPTPPSRSDDPATFASKADALLAALPTMVTEINALPIDSAGDASTAAVAAANFKGVWSTLTGALSIPASVSHSGSLWLLLNDVANVATTEPGVTSDWRLIREAGMVLLATVEASAASSVEFDGYFSDLYDKYVVIADFVTSASSQTTVRYKAGGAYLTANYKNLYDHLSSTTTSWSSTAQTGEVFIKIGANTDATTRRDLTVELCGPSDTSTHVAEYRFISPDPSLFAVYRGVGTNTSTQAITAIKLSQTVGTITGTFRLYGVST